MSKILRKQIEEHNQIFEKDQEDDKNFKEEFKKEKKNK